MSRLIDADALREGFEAADFDDDQFENCDNAARIVRNAPTIDAIPVEWLRNEMNMADDRGDSEMTDAISWLLQTWQEERGV